MTYNTRAQRCISKNTGARPRFVLFWAGITPYPDYSDKGKCVTHIFITDPEIEFYGITLNSSFAEFEQKVKTRGFKITQSDETCRVAVNGGFSITFTKESISINAAITNKCGLIF